MKEAPEIIPNILLVDDRPENLMAFRAVLQCNEYNLIEVASGEEALKELLDKDFALILMDVQMPGLSGFETAMLIKKREKSEFIPLIFVTANYLDAQSSEEGYRIGAVDYIMKPFSPDTLKAKVQFFASSDLLKKTAELIKASQFALDNQKMNYGEQAVEFAIDSLSEALEDDDLKNFDN